MVEKLRYSVLLPLGKRFSAALVLSLMFIVTAVSAFATGEQTTVTPEQVITSLGTGMTSAQNYTMSGISTALPIALVIAGVIIAVTVGWRIFKRMAK